MEFVDRYLVEVARFLPGNNRQDVLTELRASIEEEVAEQANTHERLPTEEDEKSVLARFGHPLKVACAYRSQRYLIGPEHFPAFLHSLKMILIWVLAVQIVVALLAAATTGWNISIMGLAATVF